QESIQRSPGFSQLLDMLRARSTMTLESFEGYVVTLGKITPETSAIAFVGSYVGTIIDYFVAGNLVQEDGSNLVYMRPKEGQPEGKQGSRMGNGDSGSGDLFQPPPPPVPGGIPIPLGVNRRASLTLPEDWTSRDLPKLIKMIQLALGEDTEGS